MVIVLTYIVKGSEVTTDKILGVSNSATKIYNLLSL
jgi:hypothetical protein